ncbi:KPN_02809 family neutral zinc metallopeptidase [Kutzneria kofuensis]|uniref:Neutral zinc metallopeptidase n=1 Tax=Kutzneria kofuensis TaxID=103725 RepID=A0A7W9KH24_9PSEU|nr:neutral zinc metallopeptidase [Kutzneria kofuensis]MBB5892455.1 hypothetical protein [Kutzneria kofuensis]
MQFNDDADLDTSQVQDYRGSGGGGGGGFGFPLGGLALGGGGLGIVGLVLWLVISHLGGGANQLSGQPNNSQINQCKTGAQANASQECRDVALVNSIQAYWSDQFSRSGKTYKKATTIFFTNRQQTGCGTGTTGMGPFYCPADQHVYIDLSFFKELQTRFGATGGPFVEGYVLAHEYGHHVQNLLGTSRNIGKGSGATSGSVRLELQADCYAGVWANHATSTPASNGKPLITNVSQQDINNALDTASRIGDDFIQKNLGNGQVNSGSFTHGTSAQRQHWFTTGYQSGNPAACDTFNTDNLG